MHHVFWSALTGFLNVVGTQQRSNRRFSKFADCHPLQPTHERGKLWLGDNPPEPFVFKNDYPSRAKDTVKLHEHFIFAAPLTYCCEQVSGVYNIVRPVPTIGLTKTCAHIDSIDHLACTNITIPYKTSVTHRIHYNKKLLNGFFC